jgi:hypothetical protein
MNRDIDTINKICTDCIYVKVNLKSKYRNPDLYFLRRSNCKLSSKEEAKWCDFYTKGEETDDGKNKRNL